MLQLVNVTTAPPLMRTPPPCQRKEHKHERESPHLFVHGGHGQICGGSHAKGTVLVDVAAGERDFGASFDENTSTLPAERGSVNRLTYLSMGAMDWRESRGGLTL